MRRSRVVVLFASAAAVATACNALTGASDLTADHCTDCGSDASMVAIDDATNDHAKVESVDSGGDSGKLPTFCIGIVLYATYDKDLTSTVGPPIFPGTKDSLVDVGKFGKGLQVVGPSSTAYYAMDGGFPDRAGTIAFWFKPGILAFSASTDLIFAKPVLDQSSSVNETGPQFRFENATSTLGITNQNPDGGYTTAGVVADKNGMLPSWLSNDYNHLAGSWNKDTPSLRFWLNGGASSGTFAENKDSWTPQASPTGFLRLSSSVSPPNGNFDEVAIWSRELGPNEVAALYSSPVAIADACEL